MRRWWILGAVLATACSYDAGALGTDTSGESTTQAATSTSATTTGGLDTGTSSSTTAPTTTSEGSTSQASTSQASESSTGSDEVLADNGLLARWYIDEASQGQTPSLVLDYHPVEPLDLMIDDYGVDELSYTEVDGNRSLAWTGIGLNARPIVAIAGTKIETELGTSRKATFELVLAPQELSNQTSRLLHIGTGNDAGDFVIGSDGTDQLEVRWDNITRDFDASFTGARQVLHVVVDTSQIDAADRFRAYLDGVELVAQGTQAPAEGERFMLQSSSSLVFGNRADGQRSFRGSLGYVAIYINAFGPARIKQNMNVLLASDDAP